ncbi:MAG: cytochrome-c peroxidase [Fibrobacteres bacterium]|nr:cytochrome-c peroxidase [Fibrobacterota bacterium]
MRTYPIAALLTAACSFCSLWAAGPGSAAPESAWPAGKISAFRSRADGWRRALEADSSAFPIARLKAELDTLRRAYKGMEPAAETLQPQCLELFNGSPFDRVDEDEPFKIEIEHPQGLQVLEEEVYRDGPGPDRTRIRLLLAQLCGASDQIASLMQSDPPDDARLWEAAENEVTRVLAMGLSGFDSPASGKGLAESGAALRSLRGLTAGYRARLDARDKRLFASLDRNLDAAARRLESASDFDAFDRLQFIRREGNPLFASLVAARSALGLGRSGSLPGVPKADRAKPIPDRAVASRAKGLFDPAFLDKEFYALDYDGSHRKAPSREAAELGRMLFFDPVLSADNLRACASCHHPADAYAEPLPRSAAFRNPGLPAPGGPAAPATGERNAPSLVYAAYQAAQFWDSRAPILEEQIGHVVSGPLEFNTTFASIQAKVRAIPGYARAFARAFPGEGSAPVTQATITSALAQYVRSLAGWNSPFDRYARGESDSLDPAARRGFNLFMGKAGCGTCHFPPAFNGTVPPLYRETESEVLGVPASDDTLHPKPDPDPGRYGVRPAGLWKGAFKTPTVRNAALTAPYMHNGQLPTLESVVRFYNVGGGRGMGLSVPNQTLPADSLDLSPREQGDLIAFLKSLTDSPLKVDKPGKLPGSPERPELAARPASGKY